MKHLELRFTYLESAPGALLLLFLAAALTVLLYRRAFRDRPGWLTVLLALLRAAAAVSCLLILLRPVVSFDLVSKRESRVVVLIDRSLSMSIPDSVGGETRMASALRVARSAAIARLGELYRLEPYAFPSPELLPARAIPDLAPRGARTDLAEGWQGIRPGSDKVEAIVLLSDGRDNHPERLREAKLLPQAPIYAVGLGSGAEEPPDLSIDRVEAEEKVLLGNRIEVKVGIKSRGLPPLSSELALSLDGAEVARREVKLAPGMNEVRFPLVVDRAGPLTYKLSLSERPGELFRENNVRHFTVDAAEKLIQLLLYDGRVRWEYKFVRDSLARDPNVNPVGLVKTAGDRLLQQGAAPADLSQGLPSSREGLRKFDVVVLGDVGRAELSPAAMELLKVWVGEDGGGLIYLGGPRSYEEIAGSPLAEVLPVELRSGQKLAGKPQVSPALSALDHPILSGLSGYFLPAQAGGPFTVEDPFGAGGARPAADVLLLLHVPDGAKKSGSAPEARSLVLLAAQQYGRGRAIAYLTDSDWRWVMLRGAEGGLALHTRLWGQMARWAARREEPDAGGAPRLHLPRRVAMAGERVRVEARGSPERLAALAVSAAGPGGVELPVGGSREGDLWAGEFVPLLEGRYQLRLAAETSGAAAPSPTAATPRGGDGAAAGTRPPADSAPVLTVEPNTLEMDEPRPDWELLRDLSARTGGKFFTLPEVGGLGEAIIKDTGGVVTHVEMGTERNWGLYLAILVFFTLEWALRRKLFVV